MTYTILWQPSGTRFIPYFVDGQEFRNFKKRRPVAISDRDLVRGILHEYNNEDTQYPAIKGSWRSILKDLAKAFEYVSLEQLILDAASHTRTVHGCNPSKLMLEAGARLIPESAKIREDLTLDTRVVERANL